jgi:hypothetical protein
MFGDWSDDWDDYSLVPEPFTRGIHKHSEQQSDNRNSRRNIEEGNADDDKQMKRLPREFDSYFFSWRLEMYPPVLFMIDAISPRRSVIDSHIQPLSGLSLTGQGIVC